MNRQIEIALVGGGTRHIPSNNIICMTINGSNYEMSYLGSPDNLVRVMTTTTPTDVEAEVEYLAEISGCQIALINSNYIVDTQDKGATMNLKYQIPGEFPRVLTLNNVSMTVADLHTEMKKSVDKTDMDTVKADVLAAQTTITNQAATIATLTSELNQAKTDIATMEDGDKVAKKNKL